MIIAYFDSTVILDLSPYRFLIVKHLIDIFQIVEDNSGLGGFGAEIDFSNDKMVRDRVNVDCVEKCQ